MRLPKYFCDKTVPGQFTLTNIRGIYMGKAVKVGFTATNPSTYTVPVGNFRVNTYYDAAATKIVDQSGFINLVLDNTNTAPTLTMPTGIVCNNVNTPVIIKAVVPFAQSGFGLKLYFAPGFSNTNTPSNAISCAITVNAISVGPTTCTAFVNDKNFLEVSVSPASLGNIPSGAAVQVTLSNAVIGKGIKAPLYAGKYFGQMLIFSTGGTIQTGVGTGFMNVINNVLSPMILSTYTRDMGHRTVMDLSIYLPFNIESGQWIPKDDIGFSSIEFVFLKATFPTLLNDYLTAPFVPCYGITVLNKYLNPNINLLTCTIITDPTNWIISMKGYDTVTSPGLVRIHFPGLYNYPSSTYAPTLSSGPPAGILITINVYRFFRQKKVLIASSTGDLYSIGVAPIDIFDNPRNYNGPLATSTNISPTFTPNSISLPSYIDIKFTPSRIQSFQISKGGGIYLFVPALPVTSPQYYILPPQNSVACMIKSTFLSCYSYPEANILVIENMPQITANNEIIIRITGFTNAPYVEDLHKSVLVWSWDKYKKEVEQYIYPNLPPLDYGPVNDAYVLPYNYQALKQGVTYDWVFRLGDDLPAGGSLVLYYPANYYDLQSSVPCPGVQLVQGVQWLNPTNNPATQMASIQDCSIMFATSIVTIAQIQPVKKDAVIVIRFTGVKNPSQTGWTPYFQVESKTSAASTIDRNQTIKQVYITRQFDVKTIVFDAFYSSPDNGLLLGNYYLSFYPQNPIPQYGQIMITMPSPEFDPTKWPPVNKRFCNVGGSLKTYSSCTWSTTVSTITIIIDKELTIEPGMDPVRIMLPHITSFNAELSSGVVKVTTSYDGLTIDESGSDGTGRKAVTSKVAVLLPSCTMSYEPKNEGNIASYTFDFTSIIGVTRAAVIQFEFPYEYPKGLGENIVCFNIQAIGYTDIRISTLDPIQCTVSDWKINVTNHNGWTASTGSPAKIKILVFGVRNPNALPTMTSPDQQIAVWIYMSSVSVSEYFRNTGSLLFTAAPEPLFEDLAVITPLDSPRKLINAKHTVWSTATLPYTRANVHFFNSYDVPVTSPNLKIRSRTSATLTGVTYNNNSVTVPQPSSAPPSVGLKDTFELDQLSTPYDMGYHRIYVFEYEDQATKNVVAKTYPNIINRNPTNYQTTDTIITINNEQTLFLAAGTNKYLCFIEITNYTTN